MIIDTGISYSGGEWMYISTNERRIMTMVRKLAEKKPERCVIVKRPEDNDGIIYAKFDPKFLRLTAPREIHLTDEERMEMAEKFRRNIGRGDKPNGGDDV